MLMEILALIAIILFAATGFITALNNTKRN